MRATFVLKIDLRKFRVNHLKDLKYRLKMMDDIIKLSGRLRENGIPASIRSTENACKAFDLLKDDELLREALASVYLKDERQREKFNEIFDSVFKKNPKTSEEDDTDSKTSLTTKTLKTRSSAKIQKPQKVKVEKIDFNSVKYVPPLEENKDRFNESEMLQQDIMNLNRFEPELLDLCQKLGRKIANKRVRRQKQSKNMKPDIRRTIRKNLKYGGTLIELARSRPKIKKSNHFFLTDVSGSCDWISNWFFCMVYAAQNSFYNAKTFDFDNKTLETTSALDEPNLADAFIKARDLRQKNLMLHGTSNMYTAFKSFIKQANLNNKSLVLILTDCRDWAGPKSSGNPRSAEVIEYMADRSKRVLVLNPEPRDKWNVVDSCVSHYEDAGAGVFEVRNLRQLADFIAKI